MKTRQKTIEAGVLVRRPIRRFLLQQGIKFYEDKAWLDSTFYLDCSDEVMQEIYNILMKYYG